MSDIDLLNQHRETGDDEPFAQLVRNHAGWVHSMARRRLKDAHQADDVVQAVFILLHRKRPNVPNDRALVRWLHKAALYATLVAARTAQRRKHHETEAAMLPRPEEAGFEWNELAPMLDELVGRLGRRDREAILLRYYRQMSFAEVAAAMESTEEAARKRVDRAIEKLRDMAQRRGLAATAPVALGVVLEQSMITAPPAGVIASATGAALSPGASIGITSIPIAKGAMNMMILAKAKIAASIFLAGAVSIGGAAIVVAGQANKPTTNRSSPTVREYPKLSAFTDVRWLDEQTQVRVDDDTWYELQAIEEVAARDIVNFAKETYADRWQKRIAEDLVEVMDGMKHPPRTSVNLKLRNLATSETIEMKDVPMTHEKRQAIWHRRQAEDQENRDAEKRKE